MATLKQNSEALRAITDKLKSLPKKNELVELEVTENGEYNPPENADGFNKVTVATENKLPQYLSKSLTELKEADFGSATEIGLYAFKDFKSLTSVKIPKTVTKLAGYAFDGCTALIMAPDSLPNTLKEVGGWSFGKVTFPSVFTLPTSLQTAGNGAFSGSIGIETLIIPPSLKTIGYSMFSSCKQLKNVVIPEGVTKLDQGCFENCTALDHFEIPESVTTIGSDLFNSTALVEIVFPDGIQSDISRCFTDCKSLKKVVVGKGITGLTNSAFRNCSALETVVMRRETPPTLHTTTFSSCYALKEILVPIGSGNAYKTATNWSTKADLIVESEDAGGTVDTGNWLFQNEQISGMTLTGLPAPVIGTSYTCFVDGEEIATARCEEKWDGTPYISFSTEDYRVWLLYDTTVGDTDWYFNPMDSQVQSGSVSIRININGGGTND